MTEELVSIIIINWNGGAVLKFCLNSLEKLQYKNWELIVVDNASTDGSVDYLKRFKNIKLIKNKKNVGFAPANNQGFEQAEGKYVLLLNNDTLIKSDLLSVMVKKMESDSTIGVIQPKIYLMDKKDYLDNAGSFITNTGFLLHWGYLEKDSSEFNHEKEIYSAKGACLFTRKELIDKVGLFDDEFVSYFEETDFCGRAWILGYKVIFFPLTSIQHKVGFTSKRLDVIEVNYNSMKNRICSLIKNLQSYNLVIVLGKHLIIITCLMFFYLIKFQFKKARMIFDSIVWNITHLENTLNKRKRIQQLRKVSDSYIFERVGKKFEILAMLKHFGKVEKNFND